MAFRGERFMIDLSDDDSEHTPTPSSPEWIGDIKERAVSGSAVAPTARQVSLSATGFPEHRKRHKQSTFKRQRAVQDIPTTTTVPPRQDERHETSQYVTSTPRSIEQGEKKSIDEENKQRLAAMSPAQIERERAELMLTLPPSLIDRLLRKANIDDEGQGLTPTPPVGEEELPTKGAALPATKPSKSVAWDIPDPEPKLQRSEAPGAPDEQDLVEPPAALPMDDRPPRTLPELFPASQPPRVPIHFPIPPPRQLPMPNLDPSSPSFLSDLQTHYFPNTPHEPSSLSWLQAAPGQPTSAYDPDSAATSVAPSALRFSLSGTLLAPRTSLSLPTALGLHHHASDPEAAGYTISELANLSRSTLPAQRCLAWQVLGRLLFRLGQGEFGEGGSGLVEGLWSTIEKEGVVAGMLAEAGDGAGDRHRSGHDNSSSTRAGGIGRHASAKAWATEAVWLWRRGGGGDRGLVKEGVVRST